MKKLLIILLVALVIPVTCTLQAQEIKQSPTQLVLMASAWNDRQFSQPTELGMKLGVQTAIDGERGLWLRMLYAKWELQESQTTQSLSPSVMMDWYAGKRWTVYVDVGSEIYVDGNLDGSDPFAGVGASRRLWTDTREGFKIPAHLDVFGEMRFADGSGQITGSYVQINIGVKFGRSIRPE